MSNAAVRSAGILLYRSPSSSLQVWIAHMGGPFWARKDDGAWSIPKGEYTGEEALDAARREFREEVGIPAPDLPYVSLGSFRQRSGKVVDAFAAEYPPHGAAIPQVVSNTFELEWPPRSGRMQAFPEIDRGGWFGLEDSRPKLVTGQRAILDALRAHLEPGT